MLDYGTDYEVAEVVAADRMGDAVVAAVLGREIYCCCCSNSVEIGDARFELSMGCYWTMPDSANITRSEALADARTGWERSAWANHRPGGWGARWWRVGNGRQWKRKELTGG